jgi:hypothetical protein
MEKYREPTPSSMAAKSWGFIFVGKVTQITYNRSSTPFNRLRRLCLSKNSIRRLFHAHK